jgi:hypothetical protein
LTVLALLSLVAAGFSLAWACTEPGYGTPSDPSAPPTKEPAKPAQPAPAPAAPAESGQAAAPAPAPSTAPAQTGAPASAPTVAAASASGAVREPSQARAPRPAESPTRRPATVPPRQPAASVPTGTALPATGRAQLAARERGATAGVAQIGGQTVFRSSTAPARARGAERAAARTRPARERAARPTPTRAARVPADVWSPQPAAASLASADELGRGSGGGPAASVIAGLVILGVGLAGLTGGFLVAAERRRRLAHARRRSS